MRRLNVLIACEESQAETAAFRALGHRAFSADLQRARKGTDLGTHFVGDCRRLFKLPVRFRTEDGRSHYVSRWDLIIAHPPCTYLCRLSSCQLVIHGIVDEHRLKKMEDARSFFLEMLDAPAHYVAVENPVPMKRARLPPANTYIQPSWFGVKYTKKTLYWLKNLPPIMPTIIHPNTKCYVQSSRGKYRSRTFPQVANAIALQWSTFILNDS